VAVRRGGPTRPDPSTDARDDRKTDAATLPRVKILHVVPTYLPARRYGGPIVAVHGLCKALVARGNEVDVFTTNVDGDGTLDVPLATPVDMDGVRVHYFPSKIPRIYYAPAMRIENRYHVVHSHAVYLWPGIAATKAARRLGIPYVISPRGMLVPELIAQKSALAKKLWLALFEKRAFRGAAGIHFTSQLEWEEAERTGMPLPSPFVIPNGIDLVPRPTVPRAEKTLLFLGRINWKKGLDRVISAMPDHDAQLEIAGNDEEHLTPRLEELAARIGVADRVTFLGPVYGDAKYDLMARAALFVLASTSENFGNTVIEAMMMETPVVLSKDVGLAEDVVRAKAGAIGLDAIAELLRDPARRAEMGRNGRQLVESRFTWDRVAEQMEDAYRRCSSTSRQ
jgi:glycosyltransferase involved in cell wall biosynthesis